MISISDLTYRIAGRTLLDGASLQLPDGARAGFVGRNGTGKTTLFRLMLGEIEAESGTIQLPRGARIGHVAQEAPGGPDSLIDFVLRADTERAELFAAAETETDAHRIADIQARLVDIGAHAAEGRAARILAGLGFDAAAQQRPCADFSGGWRMRVALAAVLFSEPDILLLDEPTNYLDLEGTLWLQTYLAQYPKTAIVISHDRDLLNEAVDTIVHLDKGKLTFYRGGYDQFDRQRREKLILQAKAKKKQDEQRKHLQSFVDRFRAKATKARQAQSRLKALAKLEPIAAIMEEYTKPIRIPDPMKELAPPILRFEGVSVGYEADRPILARLNLRIDPDDRIALLGSNGNGKSTFAKLVTGRLQPMGGLMTRAEKMEIAYFAQHQLDEIDPNRSAVDQVRARLPGLKEAEVRARVDGMGLATEKMETPAGQLSGGEKARLMLGLATLDKPHLVVLDEPTNHLDIEAREALVQALAEYSGAVLLISHDRHLVEAAADRLWLVAGGTVAVYDGDIDDYRAEVLGGGDKPAAGKASSSDAASAQNRGKEARRAAAERRAQFAPLKREIDKAEKEMEKLNGLIAELDVKLSDPTLFTANASEGARLSKQRADAEKRLAETEEKWLEMSHEYEEGVGE